MPGKQGDNGARDDANGKTDASHGRPATHDEEQLSAYLDGELDAAERAALEHRLAQDATLQRALGELRQTRALLRALPTPAAPRSFALPEVGDLTTTARAHPQQRALRDDDDAHMTGPLRTMPRIQAYRRDASAPRISARATRSARVAQWMGTLVAVLGLALLLGATLPAHAPSASRASATYQLPSQHTASGGVTNAPSGATTGAGAPGTFGPNIGQHASSPSADSAPTPTPGQAVAAPSGTSAGASPGAAAPSLAQMWLPALGVLLLIGGIILFAYGRLARPRR